MKHPAFDWSTLIFNGRNAAIVIHQARGQIDGSRCGRGGGGRHLHAVGDGVRWGGPGGSLAVRTLDAPLVAPGRPSLLDPDPTPLDLAGGAWVCLHDNVWGTNFPMWCEGAARFRFEVVWAPQGDGGG